MAKLILILLSIISLALSAKLSAVTPSITAPASTPLVTIAPALLAREITSCALVKAPAFTIDGHAYPASSSCTCNGGVEAGASRTVGKDGATTWECAANSTPMPISTEEPAPTPTWVIQLNIGTQKFMVGDWHQDELTPLMGIPCGVEGCDPKYAQDFHFNWTSSSEALSDGALGAVGVANTALGTVTMSGNGDGIQARMEAMLKSINTAVLKSSQCEQVTSLVPSPLRRRFSPGTEGYITQTIPQCHLVNYVSSTIYNGPDPQNATMVASIMFEGSSEQPAQNFACDDLLPVINTALNFLPLPALTVGGLTLAQAVCGATQGGS